MIDRETTKQAILQVIQAAHRMQWMGNWIDGAVFASQAAPGESTESDGVFGHGYRAIQRIRESGLVQPGGLEMPFDWYDCEDWGDVDSCIWDNCMSEPSLEDLAQLYLFNEDELEAQFGHRWE